MCKRGLSSSGRSLAPMHKIRFLVSSSLGLDLCMLVVACTIVVLYWVSGFRVILSSSSSACKCSNLLASNNSYSGSLTLLQRPSSSINFSRPVLTKTSTTKFYVAWRYCQSREFVHRWWGSPYVCPRWCKHIDNTRHIQSSGLAKA